MTKEELLDWGKATIKVYNGIADELGRNNVPAFYSQSDLNNIVGTDSVDVLIAGINPGSGGNYEDMIANPNWGIDPQRGMTAEQLVSGNFCKNPKHGNCTSWSLHHTWNYFRNLKIYFSGLGHPNVLDDESRFVMANATFFNTATAAELNRSLLTQTFPQTLALIRLCNPKMIVFLSGKDAFSRLASINVAGFSFRYDKDNNPVLGRILMGEFNDIPCYGVPHPAAYLTKEEKALIARFFAYVYKKDIDHINIGELRDFCAKENQAYHNKHEVKRERKGKLDYCQIEQAVLGKLSSYIYAHGTRIRKNENAQYGITIAKSHLYIRQAYEDKYKTPQYNPNDGKVAGMLGERGYAKDHVWLGKKHLSEFGKSEEEIIHNVIVEIVTLFDLLDHSASF